MPADLRAVPAADLAGFRAYVVSATGPSTRNPDLIASLRAIGLREVEAGGVDLRGRSAADVDAIADQRLATRIYGRALTPGEVGCAIGHRRAWQAIVDGGTPWGLVVEDDAVVLPGLGAALRAISHLEPTAPWLVALLAQSWPGHPLVVTGAMGAPGPGATGLRRVGVTWGGACAYVLSRDAARVLLTGPGRVSMVADWPPEAARCRLAAYLPYPVTTGDAGSTIEPERSAAGSALRGSSVRDRYARYVRSYVAVRPRVGGYRSYLRWWNGAGAGVNRALDRLAGRRLLGLRRASVGGTPIVHRER